MRFICKNALQFGNSSSKTGPLSNDSLTLPQVADLEERMTFGLTHRYLLGDSTTGKNIFY
jgi:hypothetical protein